jgi:fructose-1,6-bisphosphatase/inositol monophosphatase family enzyme
LLHRKEPIIGVMVLPALGETYSGAKGLGCFCNEEELHVSAVKSLSHALVSCADVPCFESTGYLRFLLSLMRKAELVRGYTDCFGHAMVLRGAVDAMIDPLVAVWDIAPIACLVKEAGGDYFSLDGKDLLQATTFVSCVPRLKDKIIEEFQSTS